MEVLLLLALLALMITFAARTAGERRIPIRVPAHLSRHRITRR
jgi:hypothetical protein